MSQKSKLHSEEQGASISDEELKALSLAIFKRHGIDFTSYEQKSLKRRIAHAMYQMRCATLHDLWVKVLKERDFIYPFMDAVSVGLTAMFRDPILWQRMRQLLDTELNGKKLTIWHAGCSTGEEVVTMGIVLKESSFLHPINSWATDISNQSLSVAKSGVYHKLRMGEYITNYLEYNAGGNFSTYYDERDGNVQMKEHLTRFVTYEYHNLITDSVKERFDIIFCRNVMIYFDNRAKMNLFEKFYNALNPGGLFVIGFYDAVLPIMDEKLFSIQDLDAKIFRKC